MSPERERMQPPPREEALQLVTRLLLDARGPTAHWTGELSASALSTAVAVIALHTLDAGSPAPGHAPHVAAGLDWLAAHANTDGGWGDTTRSRSNLSTTALVWAAFGATRSDARFPGVVERARDFLAGQAGTMDRLVPAIEARYGDDRTFSVPIVLTLALAGRLGPDGWRKVRPLPCELAALPRACFGLLRLPVVSYALPALIALGQAIHHHAPSRNPIARGLRQLTARRVLGLLEHLQPPHGGFLEATPLTAFVTMSLASMGLADHPVARRAAGFLRGSMRPDGSWPIDTNLATWGTTLALKALARQPAVFRSLPHVPIRDWLLEQQYRVVHPYTDSPPGGWAWTNLPGGVPDADDTAGALLALAYLDSPPFVPPERPSDTQPRLAVDEWEESEAADAAIHDVSREGGPPEPWLVPDDEEPSDLIQLPADPDTLSAAAAGTLWLLNLQNRDGGIPTFCRGWGRLPFDRSSPELTAHALRAWSLWKPRFDAAFEHRLDRAGRRALRYLARSQRPDGSWVPLWFGNEHVAGDENPVFGTALVLLARSTDFARREAAGFWSRGLEYLRGAQNADGSWGGARGVAGSVEETALVITALTGDPESIEHRRRGQAWLAERVLSGALAPTPIGLYFARLWYHERLYPLVLAAEALAFP